MAYLGSKPSSNFITTAKQRVTSSTNNYVDLDHAISTLADVIVWVNYVKQDATNLSLTTSTRITLGGTLTSSDVVEIAYLGKSVATQNPSDDSVTQAKIVNEAINEAKLQVSNAPTNGYFLSAQSGNTGGLTWAEAGISGVTSSSSSTALSIDANGHVTKPLQTAVVWKPTNNSAAVSADTSYTVGSGSDSATEIIDRNGDFSGYTFTAPVTGIYFLSASMHIQNYDHDNNYSAAWIETSNRQYRLFQRPNGAFVVDGGYQFAGGFVADMDASDTATWVFRNDQGTTQPVVTQERSIFGAWLLG